MPSSLSEESMQKAKYNVAQCLQISLLSGPQMNNPLSRKLETF